MDQCGRMQRVVGPLVTRPQWAQLPEPVIDQREQFAGRQAITGIDSAENFRDVGHAQGDNTCVSADPRFRYKLRAVDGIFFILIVADGQVSLPRNLRLHSLARHA